jgi:hypothetical protein
MKRLRLFLRLPAADRRLLVEAALGLAGAGILLRVLRFSRLSRTLGRHMAESPTDEPAAFTTEARRIQWAVETAARNLPWKPVCLPQAVAATRLLRRRGIASTFYLGIDPAGGYDAHAWVRVGRLIVTGGPSPDRFSVVSRFA